MRYLTDRQEIAEAMNFGKYPVLTLNRENRPFEDNDFSEGCGVRLAWDRKDSRYEGMTSSGNLYRDENGKMGISGGGAHLKESFGYMDVMEMADRANWPVIHRGQEVVVVEEWPSKRECTVRLMKVSDRIDIHCVTMAVLEEL